jgi:hypothetical protein
VGFAIVGMFVVTWIFAMAIWRLARIEDRWTARLKPAVGSSPASDSLRLTATRELSSRSLKPSHLVKHCRIADAAADYGTDEKPPPVANVNNVGCLASRVPRVCDQGFGMLIFTSTSGLIFSAPSMAENGLIPNLR